MAERKGIRPTKLKALAAREPLRERYLPRRVRILFVGEAPPASGRFFYQGDSGLYRAVKDTFVAAFPWLREANFLEAFQSLGCYLVDLCGQPVDKMTRSARMGICQAGERHLARKLLRLCPEIIVIVVRSIASNVRRAEMQVNWTGKHVELPYPGRWHHHRIRFRRNLIPLLRSVLSGVAKTGEPPSTSESGS